MGNRKTATAVNVPLKIEVINNNAFDLSVILGGIFGREIFRQRQKKSFKNGEISLDFRKKF